MANARSFPGATSNWLLKTSAGLTFNTNICVWAMFKYDIVHGGGVMLGCGASGARGWVAFLGTDGKLYFQHVAGSADTSSFTILGGVWYAAQWYSGHNTTAKFKLYNYATGELVTGNGGASSALTAPASGDPLRCGAWLEGSSNFLDGQVQRLALLQTDPSDADFLAWATAGTLPGGGVVKGSWNVGNASPEVDTSGNGLDFAVTGTSVVTGLDLNDVPAERLVATRCAVSSTLNTTNRQLMSRSPHYARTDLTALKIAIPNWYVAQSGSWAETGSGSTATVTASIEYPAGTFTQVTFGGSTSGAIGNKSTLFSDWATVTIANGELFWVRIYWTSTTGVFHLPQDIDGGSQIGGGLEMGVSGITDKTTSGSVTGADNCFPPIAIVGETTERSVIIVGDSIGQGVGDTVGDSTGDFGIVARSIGPDYAYANYAVSGDRAEFFVGSHAERGKLFSYATDLISQLGSNDAYDQTSPLTAAQDLANLQLIWGYMTDLEDGRRAFQTTITGRSTSTDSWATLVNQTPSSDSGGIRTDLNDLIRAAPTGLTDYFEVADVLESARDSSLWIVDGTANYATTDGTHPTTTAYVLVRDSGVIELPVESAGAVLTNAAGPFGGPYSNGGTGVLTTAAGPEQ